jgi:hypothetical protein
VHLCVVYNVSIAESAAIAMYLDLYLLMQSAITVHTVYEFDYRTRRRLFQTTYNKCFKVRQLQI